MANTVDVVLSLRDIGLLIEEGVAFTARLRDQSPHTVDDHTIRVDERHTALTDAAGIAVLSLIPTAQYVIGSGVYRFTIAGALSFEADVPLLDATVRELQLSGPGPANASPPGQLGHFYSENPPAGVVAGVGNISPGSGEYTYWDGTDYVLPTNARPIGGGGSFYVQPNIYDAATQTMAMSVGDGSGGDIPALSSLMFGRWPANIDRSGADLNLVLNGTNSPGLFDEDGGRIKPRDITPGRAWFGFLGTAYRVSLIQELGIRPQDYTIYHAWKIATDVPFVEADFLRPLPDGASSDTNRIYIGSYPATTDPLLYVVDAVAVPADTGDLTALAFQRTTTYPRITNNSLASYVLQPNTIDINGRAYKVWQLPEAAAFPGDPTDSDCIIEQRIL